MHSDSWCLFKQVIRTKENAMQCKRKCIRNGAVHQKAKQARAKLLDAFMIFYFIFYLVCTFIIFFHSFMCNFNLALREKRTKEWKTAQLFRSISVTKKKNGKYALQLKKRKKKSVWKLWNAERCFALALSLSIKFDRWSHF